MIPGQLSCFTSKFSLQFLWFFHLFCWESWWSNLLQEPEFHPQAQQGLSHAHIIFPKSNWTNDNRLFTEKKQQLILLISPIFTAFMIPIPHHCIITHNSKSAFVGFPVTPEPSKGRLEESSNRTSPEPSPPPLQCSSLVFIFPEVSICLIAPVAGSQMTRWQKKKDCVWISLSTLQPLCLKQPQNSTLSAHQPQICHCRGWATKEGLFHPWNVGGVSL